MEVARLGRGGGGESGGEGEEERRSVGPLRKKELEGYKEGGRREGEELYLLTRLVGPSSPLLFQLDLPLLLPLFLLLQTVLGVLSRQR